MSLPKAAKPAHKAEPDSAPPSPGLTRAPGRSSFSTPRRPGSGSLTPGRTRPDLASDSRPASFQLGPLTTGGSLLLAQPPLEKDLHETFPHWLPPAHLTLAPYAHVENCCCRLVLASLPSPPSGGGAKGCGSGSESTVSSSFPGAHRRAGALGGGPGPAAPP